jgi:hypothetical protein
MPANENVASIQQSGSANVPLTESTGGQLQGTQGNQGNIYGSSASGTPVSFADVYTSAIVASGNVTTNNQLIVTTNFVSGTSTAGFVLTGASGTGFIASGAPPNATASANQSHGGLNAPAGFFFVNMPSSGSPWVKVPFYNS